MKRTLLVCLICCAAAISPVAAQDENLLLDLYQADGYYIPTVDDAAAGGEPQSYGAWQFVAEAIWLQRHHGDPVTLATDQAMPIGGGSFRRVTTDGLDYQYQPGLRLGVGFAFDEDCLVEVNYFGINEWDDTQYQTAIGGFSSQYIGSDEISSALFDQLTIDVETELYNVELNVWHRLLRTPAFYVIGIRHLRVRDRIRLLGSGTMLMGDDTTLTSTENDLWGLQAGAKQTWTRGRAAVTLIGKAGLLGNQNEQHTANSSLPAMGSGESTSLATVVELSLQGSYQLTTGVFLRAGYQVLFLQGLALAPDNLHSIGAEDPSLIGEFNRIQGIDNGGQLFMDGFNAGLEVVY